MKRDRAKHRTTSAMSSKKGFILILKQLLIDRNSIDIYTGVFLGEMCSDRCKNHGCRQKMSEGTSSAMFDVLTIAKCCEFKRCTSSSIRCYASYASYCVISVKKILAVINATYAVAKRKPEKIRLAVNNCEDLLYTYFFIPQFKYMSFIYS